MDQKASERERRSEFESDWCDRIGESKGRNEIITGLGVHDDDQNYHVHCLGKFHLLLAGCLSLLFRLPFPAFQDTPSLM
jgi:hypothetical protein